MAIIAMNGPQVEEPVLTVLGEPQHASWESGMLVMKLRLGEKSIPKIERGGSSATPYDVAKLLGDTVDTIEKHYAPFVKELRDRSRRLMGNGQAGSNDANRVCRDYFRLARHPLRSGRPLIALPGT